MGLIQASSQFTNVDKDEDKFRFIQVFQQQVQSVVNGKIEFVSNIQSKLKQVTFTATDTDTSIDHGLGIIPNGYFIVGLSAAMIIYDGSLETTSSVIFLRSSAIGIASIMFF